MFGKFLQFFSEGLLDSLIRIWDEKFSILEDSLPPFWIHYLESSKFEICSQISYWDSVMKKNPEKVI